MPAKKRTFSNHVNILASDNGKYSDYMDYGAMLSESFEYAKEALLGKWVRWILFIILGLPFALVKFTIDPNIIVDKATGTFHPELIHWDQLLILIGAGILLGFFIAGYMVRIYRGTKPAPELDNWAGFSSTA
jgi:hypothetical protein